MQSCHSAPVQANFKFHKLKYRWITNAHECCFSIIADLLTTATNAILPQLKSWAAQKQLAYFNFLHVDTSLFWIVQSTLEVALNLPAQLNDIFVADISRCYEAIPTTGKDALGTAISACIHKAFQQAKQGHRAVPYLYIRFDHRQIKFTTSRWSTSPPADSSTSTWIELSETRLCALHNWLMQSCLFSWEVLQMLELQQC